MGLTAVQQLYLTNFSNTGEVSEALDQTTKATKQPLNRDSLYQWADTSPEFCIEYKKVRQSVVRQLKDENYILALKQINNYLKLGYVTDHELTNETITEPGSLYKDAETGQWKESEPKEITKTKSSVKRRGLSPAFLKLALGATAIENAIHQFASEGLLSDRQYNALIQSAGEISEKIVSVIDPMDNQHDEVSNDRAVAILKQALMGSNLAIS